MVLERPPNQDASIHAICMQCDWPKHLGKSTQSTHMQMHEISLDQQFWEDPIGVGGLD
ncbi:hypothetical protein Hanom_Chr08g00725491 [Helianthus anomalus]